MSDQEGAKPEAKPALANAADPKQTERPLRVVIADDHPMFRRGLRGYLEARGLEVAAEAVNGREAVEVVARAKPDLAILDVRMPGMSGLEALARIKKTMPQVVVIIMTAHGDTDYFVEAVLAGASGFLLKVDPEQKLEDVIRDAVSGERAPEALWWKVALRRIRERESADKGLSSPPKELSPKEIEVMRHLARGLSASEIARLEGLNTGTVRTHCTNAFRKLGVSDRLQAVLLGIRQGWLRPDAPDQNF